jgi:hypothetical protein
MVLQSEATMMSGIILRFHLLFVAIERFTAPTHMPLPLLSSTAYTHTYLIIIHPSTTAFDRHVRHRYPTSVFVSLHAAVCASCSTCASDQGVNSEGLHFDEHQSASNSEVRHHLFPLLFTSPLLLLTVMFTTAIRHLPLHAAVCASCSTCASHQSVNCEVLHFDDHQSASNSEVRHHSFPLLFTSPLLPLTVMFTTAIRHLSLHAAVCAFCSTCASHQGVSSKVLQFDGH